MPIAPLVAAWQRGHRNVPGPFMGRETLTVSYPTTRLDCRVYVALGADLSQPWYTWSWTDITGYVRFNDGITITDGRRDWAGRSGPGSGMMRLDNRTGLFARRNPLSPYYGLLTANTPIWATVDAGAGVKTRMQHYVNEWPVRWDKSATDSTVPIATAGILRRLAQGRVLKSPLRRAIQAASPAAYWPLEDDTDSAFGALFVGSGSNLTASSGTIEFGTGAPLPAGTSAAADFSSGASGTAETGIPSGTADAAGWELECTFGWDVLPSFSAGQTYLIAAAETPGSTTLSLGVGLVEDSGQIMRMIWGWNGTTLASGWNSTPGGIQAGRTYQVTIRALQNGAETRVHYWFDGVYVDAVIPFVTATLTNPTRVLTNPAHYLAGAGNGKANPTSLSHLAVWSVARSFAATTGSTAPTGLAADGYAGELAHERIKRVCAEEGIAYRATSASTVAMGPQPQSSALEVLRECEDADLGTLYEVDWGLGYQSTLDRYNAPVAMTVDFDLGQVAEPPEPADDDQRTRNRWTVNRSGGSEYTAEKKTGPMGTGSEGPGIYDDQTTVNVETDDQLPSQAGWRVHLGTVDEDRWPQLALNFAAAPELIDMWTSLPYGSRVNFIHPPDDGPPDTIDAFVEGRAERWDGVSWRAVLNTSPASPYDVQVVGETSGNRGRVDMANSTLAADATSGATTISVASTGALWRTGTVNFDIGVAGERMTVTNISGGSSPQTFTVTRSVNGIVKEQPSIVGGRAVKVSLWKPSVYAL